MIGALIGRERCDLLGRCLDFARLELDAAEVEVDIGAHDHGVASIGRNGHGALRHLGLGRHLARHFVQVVDRELFAIRQKAQQQQAVTDGVDAPRDAAAGFVQRVEDARAEDRLAVRAGALETMQHVLLRLVEIERADVAGGGNALAELLHLGPLQDLAELGLTDEKALQQRLVAELEIRQHAQLFNRARREVLRLVHHKQAALALARLADEKGLERDQQL